MQSRMIRATAFEESVQVVYDGTREYRDANFQLRKDPEQFIVRTSGWYDRTDEEDVRIRQEFGAVFGTDATEDLAGTAVSVGDHDYVRFTTMPDRVGAVDVGELRGKWLRYDLDRLRGSIDAPLFGSVGRAFTAGERDELLRRVAASAFVSHVRTLPKETINGVRVFHYETMPEPLYFKDFLVREESIRLGRILTEKELTSVDSSFGSVTPLTSEVWIGTRDYRLYRIILRFRVTDEGRTGIVEVTATFGSFGSRTEIAQPDGKITDVDDILAKLLPAVAEHLPLAQDGSVRVMAAEEEQHVGLPVDVRDPKAADGDKDGLTDSMEFFFGTDPAIADTDGDGMEDGAEVDEGRDPRGPGMLFDFVRTGR
jgi:hypothetical protein